MRLRLALAGLPLFLIGCVSSTSPATSDDSGTTLPPEDSGLPAVDGTVPASDAGHDSSIPETSVGADTSTGDSATATDTGTDAPIDAGPLPVTVTVTNDIGPEPGVTVLFQSAAGAITSTGTTDATGKASAVVAANGQVTLVFGKTAPSALLTIQGVQPGDVLTAIDTVNEGFPIPGTPNVSVTSVPDVSSDDAAAPVITTYYASAGTCTSSGASFPLGVNVGFPCEVGGKFPMLVTGTDQGGIELGYTYQKGSSLLTDGGTFDMTIDTPWSFNEATQTLSAINVPNNSAWFGFTELAGGVGSSTYTSYSPGSTDGGPNSGTGSLNFTLHPNYAEAVQQELTVLVFSGSFSQYQSIAARIDVPDGSPAQFDMSQSLPAITGSTIDQSDAGTSSAPVITWSSAGSLATADGLILVVQGNLATDAGSSSLPWTIVAPPTAASVTMPSLPATLAWTVTQQSYQVAVVIGVEATFIPDYAHFRTLAGALPPSNNIVNVNQGLIAPPLPADGVLRMTAVSSGD